MSDCCNLFLRFKSDHSITGKYRRALDTIAQRATQAGDSPNHTGDPWVGLIASFGALVHVFFYVDSMSMVVEVVEMERH